MRLSALLSLLLLLFLAGCGGGRPDGGYLAGDRPPDRARALDPSNIADAVPKTERLCSGCNNSYQVNGQRYQPLASASGYQERGIASWYGQKFHGRATASGETYDMYAATAAHRTLPLPSYAQVTNLNNGRSIVLKVNDRGPFVDNRLIDLSYAAAVKLGVIGAGTALVEVRAIAPGQQPAATNWSAAALPALYLQVGAFHQPTNANQLKARLQRSGFGPIRIAEAQHRGRRLLRVQIGPLKTVPQADQLGAQLAAQGHDTVRVIVE